MEMFAHLKDDRGMITVKMMGEREERPVAGGIHIQHLLEFGRVSKYALIWFSTLRHVGQKPLGE